LLRWQRELRAIDGVEEKRRKQDVVDELLRAGPEAAVVTLRPEAAQRETESDQREVGQDQQRVGQHVLAQTPCNGPKTMRAGPDEQARIE
jgi:hypothetical protein